MNISSLYIFIIIKNKKKSVFKQDHTRAYTSFSISHIMRTNLKEKRTQKFTTLSSSTNRKEKKNKEEINPERNFLFLSSNPKKFERARKERRRKKMCAFRAVLKNTRTQHLAT